ncbi:DUF1837 domain-containing protein [Sinorhizobium sp. 7-81]|uniref:HamA C-terminal domain-containing protein n=1 Tax=Sinorhizobium sp. 8-89 TaxID=3049089 RepID=UPI0024C250A0|nr:DUF1837 domain-containing protein [Sinorhizobium sp. 8-89]MDK1492957.1 DUF1837 domain-containing protein [Sinorhizobium sp. 8-89]
MTDDGVAIEADIELVDAIAALSADCTALSKRLHQLDHTITTDCAGLTLRLHYPAFRQGKAMVGELVDAISHHIVAFCLPRTKVAQVDALYGSIPVAEFKVRLEQLRQSAFDLFKRAQLACNRNGEAGELLLYLFTEWVLGAPQILAKMSLKTNSQMPVHGADGVHVRFCPETKRLFIYWGESKLHKDLGKAINDAAKSIAESLTEEKVKHEIALVHRNLDLSGLPSSAKEALLCYLDPYADEYVHRYDVITCLISFDFDGFAKTAADPETCDAVFRKLAEEKLKSASVDLAQALKDKGLNHQPVEMFFMPVPSVARLRELFQDKIGWKPMGGS